MVKIPKKVIFKRLSINFSHNKFKHNHQIFFKNNFFEKLFKGKLNKLTLLCTNLFILKKNILFLDYNFNFNYLPIIQKNLIEVTVKNLHKLTKFYNINSIIFFNLNKKKALFKKFFNMNLINISTTHNQKSFDLNLSISNSPILHYILFIYISQIYLKVSNNNLNEWCAIIFSQTY